MTREENLHWLNEEIRTWENECQSKHPIKEALYAARKALEQEPCEDAVSRAEVLNLVRFNAFHVKSQIKAIENMPSVTPQEPQTFKWCTNCKEYDQEKHCCHRWSNVIRDTVEEMKQEYIEREVLDKIRAEIEAESAKSFRYPNWERAKALEWALSIIDKYKTESEET